MNDHFDEEIRRIVRGEPLEPADERSRALQRDVTEEFATKRKQVLTWYWVFFALTTATGFAGIVMVTAAGSALFATQGLSLIVIGFTGQTLIKLWYWQMDTKLSLVQEIKQLRIQLVFQQTMKAESEN